MKEQVISFYNCCPVPQQKQISVEPAAVERGVSITVGKSVMRRYAVMSRKLRSFFTRCITVRVSALFALALRRVCRFCSHISRNSGFAVLRQSEILRI